MNLHIAPDNTFTNKFYENLREIGAEENNRIVVRTNDKALKHIRYPLPFGALYTENFNSLVGDTMSYEKVFIHYFTPLLYRWVARNKFKELNWMVWGGDLYNLPELDNGCYEPITWKEYVKKDRSWQTTLYNLKVAMTQKPFRKEAYGKVRNILTWMKAEFDFACKHLPVHSEHRFFFYENQMPYQELDNLIQPLRKNPRPVLIVGNSASPTNNHLDVIDFLNTKKIEADLHVPISYGDQRYAAFLRKHLKYHHGTLTFMDQYLPFHEYLSFLNSSDGLVMNTIRPQGYGNILMMMYLNKPVFFNEKNISLPDLNSAGFSLRTLGDLRTISYPFSNNKAAVTKLLSHQRLVESYHALFD